MHVSKSRKFAVDNAAILSGPHCGYSHELLQIICLLSATEECDACSRNLLCFLAGLIVSERR